MENKADDFGGVGDEHIEESTHTQRDAHIAIHTDTYDIDEDALGKNLPKNYYMSPGFIGTVVVRPAPQIPESHLLIRTGIMSRKHQQLPRLGLAV